MRKPVSTVAHVLLSAVLASGLPTGAWSLVHGLGAHRLCVLEDDTACVWLAHVQGNGRGWTFATGQRTGR